MADEIKAKTTSARFGLVTYRDQPYHTGDDLDYPGRVDLDFTDDANALKSGLAAAPAFGGGDTPESMYSGIMTAVGMKWRPGVEKAIVVLADAPPHDPEHVTAYTAKQVADAAIAVDPAEVYVIDTGGAMSPQLKQVVAATGGASLAAAGSSRVPGAMSELIGKAIAKPYAWINGPYLTPVGRSLELDGSGSQATTGSLTRYEWDFDADGSYDQTTTTPRVSHTWTSEFTGLVSLRVTDSEGRQTVANTRVAATADGDDIATAADNCPKVANMGQEDYDEDGLGDLCDPIPGAIFASAWPFEGFDSPIKNQPALNTVKAGQSVPFKFSVGGNRGLDILKAATATPVSCESLKPAGDPAATSSRSGLSFDPATGKYTWVWKSSKQQTGTCQVVTLTFTDGSSHSAQFVLR